MQQIGLSFLVRPADIDETPGAGETPEHYVERLARAKALAVAQSSPECLVLGSDTSVVLDRVILGKPSGASEARAMLARLNNGVDRINVRV